jgi:hypothetical protein
METVKDLDHEIETIKSQAAANSLDVWKWIAGILFAVLLFLAGFVSKGGGITRAEAESLVASAANPYVQDKPAIEQRMKSIEGGIVNLNESNATLDRKINRICIAMGIDPDSPDPYVRRKAH